MHFDFELTSTPITSTAGLAFIGQQLAETKFERHLASICPHQRPGGRIPDADIAKSMIGLFCVGKPHFDAISEYNSEPFFAQSLRLSWLPSAEILRQRIQSMPEQAGEAFRGLVVRKLRNKQDQLTEEHYGVIYVPVHVDATPMDNSDSNKEGVSWTYKKFDGYTPIIAYIGPPGYMLNNQLREGSAHCNCEGTREWFKKTLEMAASVTDHRRLVVTDSGHDAAENIELFDQTPDTDFLIKRNLRSEDPADWLELAQKQTYERGEECEQPKTGVQIWYGERDMPLPGQSREDEPKTIRVTFRVIDRFADSETGQFDLLGSRITVDSYWTSLDWTPKQIQAYYEKHGTSEQFHSELKSDMGLERLPSGKFLANQHLLDLGMIAFNLLRMLGQQSLGSGLVPGRKSKSKRLRLRTVMQNLIYMAGRVVRHARRRILRIFEGHAWSSAALEMARGPS